MAAFRLCGRKCRGRIGASGGRTPVFIGKQLLYLSDKKLLDMGKAENIGTNILAGCRTLGYALLLIVTAACATAPHSVLELAPSEGNCRNSEGDFIRLSDGRLLFAYSKFLEGNGDDDDRCVIAARFGSRNGEKWSGEDLIVATNTEEPEGNVMSVSFLRLDKKRIALFYLQKVADERGMDATRIMMKVTCDDGRTWGPGKDCTGGMPLQYRVVNNGRIHRLSGGRVVIPVAHHDTSTGNFVSAARIFCIWSDDNCETWHEGESFCLSRPDGSRVVTQEPGIMELEDGSVLMYLRTDGGSQWYAISRDGGESWGGFREAPFVGPLSPATMFRLRDGRLLLVWNDHSGWTDSGKSWVRTPLTLAVSDDEGESWRGKKNLEDGYDPAAPRKYWYCYTSGIELRGRILLAYCAEDNLQHLRITSVPLKWLD